jgi:hypothetical protein
MAKIVGKYNFRFQNHRGDLIYLVLILVTSTLLILGYTFTPFQAFSNGPPISNFDKIIPKDSTVFTYYDVPDPKARVQLRAADVAPNDLLFSKFTI